MSIRSLVEDILPGAVELRHRLHAIPELGYEEYRTAAAIRAELTRLGIPYIAELADAPTATVALVGDKSKPCIAFRADIDALPITERTGLAYQSTHPGRMHACGHDGHSAGLAGVAAALKKVADRLPVCVKLIWQPAEEGGGGAERVIKAGVLDGRIGPKVSAMFGAHGWPGLKVGMVASKPGPLLAATDNFVAKFVGRGCHGAFPHLGRDPIAAAAEAVLSLQHIASREADPTDAVVVTVGLMHAGTAVNIIPDSATFEGTARTLTDAMRKSVAAAIERRCRGIAQAHDCALEFSWSEGYPPTINDPAMADYLAATVRETLGPDAYLPVAVPSMGGEDFSYYIDQVPGCFFLIGVEPLDCPAYPPLHSDLYDFTDAALATSIRTFVELALRWDGRA